MKITDTVQYEDFKYVMTDTGSLYIGARYSYEELLEDEMLPFKMKAIITHYIYKESSPETTLESEFYYLEENSFLFHTYEQLKVRVKIRVPKEHKNLFGKSSVRYCEEILSVRDLAKMNLAKKKAAGVMINEIIISKLAMMTFSV